MPNQDTNLPFTCWNPIERIIVNHNIQSKLQVWIGCVSTKRQATTVTSGASGRQAYNGVYKTVLALISEGGLGEGVGCGMMGSAGGRGAETCLRPYLSIDQL